METCIYNNKTICSYDLKSKNGYYIEDLVDEWKLAASQKRLSCADCGAPVYLAAGPIKEPYFAHFDDKECPYSVARESERSKEGKRILYTMLKECYSSDLVTARHRFGNGMYCTAFADIKEGFAIDFRMINLSYAKFDEREQFYTDHNIHKLYILGSQKGLSKQYLWYLGQIQRAQGFCVLFDVSKKELTIYKRIRYQNQYRALCYEEYQFKDMLEQFSFNESCELTYNKNGTFQSVLALVNEHEEKLKRHHLTKSDNFSPTLSEKCMKAGLNELALKNSMKHIKEGKAEFVSEKYRNFIYENFPQLAP